jgi:hypothetical protein
LSEPSTNPILLNWQASPVYQDLRLAFQGETNFITRQRYQQFFKAIEDLAERAWLWARTYVRVKEPGTDLGALGDNITALIDWGDSDYIKEFLRRPRDGVKEYVAERIEANIQNALSQVIEPMPNVPPEEFEQAATYGTENPIVDELNKLIQSLEQYGYTEAQIRDVIRQAAPRIAAGFRAKTPAEMQELKRELESIKKENQQLLKNLQAMRESKIPKPKYAIGETVIHSSLGRVEVTDFDLNPERTKWIYTVKNAQGQEFLAEDYELTPSGEKPKEVVTHIRAPTPEEVKAAFGPLGVETARVKAGAKFPGLPIPPGCPPESFSDVLDMTEEQSQKAFAPFYEVLEVLNGRFVPEGTYFVCLAQQPPVFYKRTLTSVSGALPRQRLQSIPLPNLVRELRGYLPKARPEVFGPGEFGVPAFERQLPVGSRVFVIDIGKLGTVTQSFVRGGSVIYEIRLDSGEVIGRFSDQVRMTGVAER